MTEPFQMGDATIAIVELAAFSDPHLLSGPERALVEEAKTPERRGEVLGGRLAAHEAFRAAGVEEPPSVLRAKDGRPRLEPPQPGWYVSLAHDAGLACAAVSEVPVGVDVFALERLASATRVVERRIATGRARSLRRTVDVPVPDAALLWTGWEALGKLDGEGVLRAMERELVVVALERPGVWQGRAAGVQLRWWTWGDALFCLATVAGLQAVD